MRNRMKRVLGLLLLAATLLTTVFGCAGAGKKEGDTTESLNTTDFSDTVEQPKYLIQLADLGENVEIHTKGQLEYLSADYADIADYVPAFPTTERSYPKEVVLSWSVNGSELLPFTVYEVSVSTSPDMSDAKIYTTRNNRYSLYNLYLDTAYYWKVAFSEEGVVYESGIASFKTTWLGPRNLKIDGVTNCRDLGGWSTVSGKTVKQGMLYRTGKLSKTNSVMITKSGMKTMLEELGVKTEIDLRSGSNEIREESVLEGVQLFNLGCSGSAMSKMQTVLPDIFEVLADESNYPIFFHCAIGTDRTGAVAYLVNGLLGVYEEDLYYDYCFSDFGAICGEGDTDFNLRTPETIQKEDNVAAVVSQAPGDTLQQKVRNYLKSLGITDETLDAIVRIMLE